MVYIVIGAIVPLAIAILLVINETTYNIGNGLRWIFYVFPIFALDYGVMAISEYHLFI